MAAVFILPQGFDYVWRANRIGLNLMTPYFQDNWTALFNGDSREVLKALPDESVNCVVTSPPYFGLRDYGTATWEGGGSGCDHAIKLGGNGAASKKQVTSGGTQQYQYKEICGKCGGQLVDRQIGLEQTPEQYVATLVDVFREVRRVLRDDGTVWLNLGDSYAGSGKGGQSEEKRSENWQPEYINKGAKYGFKPKDLLGIPWRVAFALQSDGWYLRQDIIWSKPNPMPESVTDRCTKSHEYIFLLSKSPRYYYNQDAIKEPLKDSSISRLSQDIENQHGSSRVPGKTNGTMKAVRFGGNKYGDDDSRFLSEKSGNAWEPTETVNKRSVWTVTTKPYTEAHFAVFPPDLIRPCILAGSPVGGVVLDPFAGSGTALQVAREAQCRSIGIELNPDYCRLIMKRMRQGVLNFGEETA